MTVVAEENTVVAGGAGLPIAGLVEKFGAWPGPVIEVMRDGTVVAANDPGREMAALLLADGDGPLRGLILLAFDAGGSVSDRSKSLKTARRVGMNVWFCPPA